MTHTVTRDGPRPAVDARALAVRKYAGGTQDRVEARLAPEAFETKDARR